MTKTWTVRIYADTEAFGAAFPAAEGFWSHAFIPPSLEDQLDLLETVG